MKQMSGANSRYLSFLQGFPWIVRKNPQGGSPSIIDDLEKLRAYYPNTFMRQTGALLSDMGELAIKFEAYLPETRKYFEGLRKRCPKAMSFGDMVTRIANAG